MYGKIFGSEIECFELHINRWKSSSSNPKDEISISGGVKEWVDGLRIGVEGLVILQLLLFV